MLLIDVLMNIYLVSCLFLFTQVIKLFLRFINASNEYKYFIN